MKGVQSVTSGYAGGEVKSPTYQQVSTGTTGHAEVVQVTFDPNIIPYSDILDIFWTLHDPTTLNRQGNDVGTQYRSVIFYTDDTQRGQAEKSRRAVQKLWPDSVVTEIMPLKRFYPAEEHHQDYFKKNPAQPYCQIVINPKLEKLKEKFASRLRKNI